jgi:phosphomevalonate kinase
MSFVIVLLSGWSCSGKDEVARRLGIHHGFLRMAFADPVKVEYAQKLQIPLIDCYDREKKEGHRMSIIRLAEERRASEPGYWARRIAADITEHHAKGTRKFVVSDWRNLAELLTLQSIFTHATLLPVRVVRPSQIVSPIPNAATEYGLLGFPFWYTVQNDGTLEDLDESCESFVACVRSITPESIWSPQ